MKAILNKYYAEINSTVIKEATSVLSESSSRFCAKDGSLGTAKIRAAYVRREFPQVSPIEYFVGKKGTGICPHYMDAPEVA